ncbi:MAG TPA: ATP-binding protein [candidate division Zixibacteria bacterium]|nr:ATP-binding protein [candidate division Zixibacteria bacterium]
MTAGPKKVIDRRRSRDEDALIRLALDAAEVGAWSLDLHTELSQWSDRVYELFGVPHEGTQPGLNLVGSLLSPEDRDKYFGYVKDLLARKETNYRYELRVQRADGKKRWLSTRGVVRYTADGTAIDITGVCFDSTLAREAEQHIAALNAELERRVADTEALLRTVPVGIAIGEDALGERVRLNERMAEFLNVVGTNISALSEEWECANLTVLRQGVALTANDLPPRISCRTGAEIRDDELEVIRPDGQRIVLYGNSIPLFDKDGDTRGSVAAYMNITSRKQAQDALRTSEKLATAGRMASSLAHEINNPLAAITNLLYLIAQDKTVGESSRRYLEMAMTELTRVSHITRNMLAFYRESLSPVRCSMAEVAASVLELYESKIRSARVRTIMELQDSAVVEGFPGELRQVISNLVVNAVEAMPHGGILRLRTRSYTDSDGMRWAQLLLADNGSGILPEHRSKIFEPFFTTKGEKGTGLGLWVTRDIVEKHGGRIEVRTRIGSIHGTCFRVMLPLI